MPAVPYSQYERPDPLGDSMPHLSAILKDIRSGQLPVLLPTVEAPVKKEG